MKVIRGLSKTLTGVIQQLSNDTGVELDGGEIVLHDTRAYSTRRILVLTDEEVRRLVIFYTDGCCPVCFEEIADGDVVCDECLHEARNNRRLFGWSS